MKKHIALLIQEEISFDELPDRIKKKIGKYNSIKNSKTFYYWDKMGNPTKRAVDELTELDDDICDLVDVFIADRQEEIDRIADEEAKKLLLAQETERLELERINIEEAEKIKQEKININKNSQKGFWETLFG